MISQKMAHLLLLGLILTTVTAVHNRKTHDGRREPLMLGRRNSVIRKLDAFGPGSVTEKPTTQHIRLRYHLVSAGMDIRKILILIRTLYKGGLSPNQIKDLIEELNKGTFKVPQIKRLAEGLETGQITSNSIKIIIGQGGGTDVATLINELLKTLERKSNDGIEATGSITKERNGSPKSTGRKSSGRFLLHLENGGITSGQIQSMVQGLDSGNIGVTEIRHLTPGGMTSSQIQIIGGGGANMTKTIDDILDVQEKGFGQIDSKLVTILHSGGMKSSHANYFIQCFKEGGITSTQIERLIQGLNTGVISISQIERLAKGLKQGVITSQMIQILRGGGQSDVSKLIDSLLKGLEVRSIDGIDSRLIVILKSGGMPFLQIKYLVHSLTAAGFTLDQINGLIESLYSGVINVSQIQRFAVGLETGEITSQQIQELLAGGDIDVATLIVNVVNAQTFIPGIDSRLAKILISGGMSLSQIRVFIQNLQTGGLETNQMNDLIDKLNTGIINVSQIKRLAVGLETGQITSNSIKIIIGQGGGIDLATLINELLKTLERQSNDGIESRLVTILKSGGMSVSQIELLIQYLKSGFTSAQLKELAEDLNEGVLSLSHIKRLATGLITGRITSEQIQILLGPGDIDVATTIEKLLKELKPQDEEGIYSRLVSLLQMRGMKLSQITILIQNLKDGGFSIRQVGELIESLNTRVIRVSQMQKLIEALETGRITSYQIKILIMGGQTDVATLIGNLLKGSEQPSIDGIDARLIEILKSGGMTSSQINCLIQGLLTNGFIMSQINGLVSSLYSRVIDVSQIQRFAVGLETREITSQQIQELLAGGDIDVATLIVNVVNAQTFIPGIDSRLVKILISGGMSLSQIRVFIQNLQTGGLTADQINDLIDKLNTGIINVAQIKRLAVGLDTGLIPSTSIQIIIGQGGGIDVATLINELLKTLERNSNDETESRLVTILKSGGMSVSQIELLIQYLKSGFTSAQLKELAGDLNEGVLSVSQIKLLASGLITGRITSEQIQILLGPGDIDVVTTIEKLLKKLKPQDDEGIYSRLVSLLQMRGMKLSQITFLIQNLKDGGFSIRQVGELIESLNKRVIRVSQMQKLIEALETGRITSYQIKILIMGGQTDVAKLIGNLLKGSEQPSIDGIDARLIEILKSGGMTSSQINCLIQGLLTNGFIMSQINGLVSSLYSRVIDVSQIQRFAVGLETGETTSQQIQELLAGGDIDVATLIVNVVNAQTFIPGIDSRLAKILISGGMSLSQIRIFIQNLQTGGLTADQINDLIDKLNTGIINVSQIKRLAVGLDTGLIPSTSIQIIIGQGGGIDVATLINELLKTLERNSNDGIESRLVTILKSGGMSVSQTELLIQYLKSGGFTSAQLKELAEDLNEGVLSVSQIKGLASGLVTGRITSDQIQILLGPGNIDVATTIEKLLKKLKPQDDEGIYSRLVSLLRLRGMQLSQITFLIQNLKDGGFSIRQVGELIESLNTRVIRVSQMQKLIEALETGRITSNQIKILIMGGQTDVATLIGNLLKGSEQPSIDGIDARLIEILKSGGMTSSQINCLIQGLLTNGFIMSQINGLVSSLYSRVIDVSQIQRFAVGLETGEITSQQIQELLAGGDIDVATLIVNVVNAQTFIPGIDSRLVKILISGGMSLSQIRVFIQNLQTGGLTADQINDLIDKLNTGIINVSQIKRLAVGLDTGMIPSTSIQIIIGQGGGIDVATLINELLRTLERKSNDGIESRLVTILKSGGMSVSQIELLIQYLKSGGFTSAQLKELAEDLNEGVLSVSHIKRLASGLITGRITSEQIQILLSSGDIDVATTIEKLLKKLEETVSDQIDSRWIQILQSAGMTISQIKSLIEGMRSEGLTSSQIEEWIEGMKGGSSSTIVIKRGGEIDVNKLIENIRKGGMGEWVTGGKWESSFGPTVSNFVQYSKSGGMKATHFNRHSNWKKEKLESLKSESV